MTQARHSLSLKVLTVNTHKGFTIFNRRFILHELRDALREVSPDLVFLQEVLGQHHRHASRIDAWPTMSHYEFLADTLWNDYAYGRNAVYPHGHHGNAVLSKFPIVCHDNLDISVDRHEKRGLLHCVIQPPGCPAVHAVCVHLGLREGHRRHQVEHLCSRIDERMPGDEPVVIAGDFNDWRMKAHRQLYRCAGMREVFVASHGTAARTFPAGLPLLRLDRIYVRGARRMRPIQLVRRTWARLSDHAPLAAEIEL